MIFGIAIAAALLTGFLTGFLCFKRTNQFCGRCGVTRECPICPPATAPPGGRPLRFLAATRL